MNWLIVGVYFLGILVSFLALVRWQTLNKIGRKNIFSEAGNDPSVWFPIFLFGTLFWPIAWVIFMLVCLAHRIYALGIKFALMFEDKALLLTHPDREIREFAEKNMRDKK